MIPDRLRTIIGPEVQELSRLFVSGGHDLYLVGGSVRDALLGRSSDDLDFTTGARPDDIEHIGTKWAD